MPRDIEVSARIEHVEREVVKVEKVPAVTLELSVEYATVLRQLTGRIVGGGRARQITTDIFNALNGLPGVEQTRNETSPFTNYLKTRQEGRDA